MTDARLPPYRQINKPTARERQLPTIDLSVNSDVEINSAAQKRSLWPLNSSSLSSHTKAKKAPPTKVAQANILKKVVFWAVESLTVGLLFHFSVSTCLSCFIGENKTWYRSVTINLVRSKSMFSFKNHRSFCLYGTNFSINIGRKFLPYTRIEWWGVRRSVRPLVHLSVWFTPYCDRSRWMDRQADRQVYEHMLRPTHHSPCGYGMNFLPIYSYASLSLYAKWNVLNCFVLTVFSFLMC